MLARLCARAPLAAACLFVAFAAAACSGTRETAPPVKVTSLTIFPITAVGSQHPEFAEVLGVLLEKNGFRRVEVAPDAFRPESGAELDAIAAAFARFAAQEKLGTEFALYCEFQGDPGTGVRGIRSVLVDAKGAPVWQDEQTPADRAFRRSEPRDPMTCCAFVSERLRPLLVAAPAEALDEEGALTRRLERASGVPEKGELEAMSARAGALRAKRGEATATVYPVRAGDSWSREGAESLAAILARQGICRAQAAAAPLAFEVDRGPNELRVLWSAATKLQDELRQAPPATDYAILADYIIAPGGEVRAVHVIVCERDGDIVIADLQNDHHDDFRKIAPRSLDDCHRLAALRLAGQMR